MGTLVSRNFKISLSDDARRRAREYLISLGYREEDFEPIVWPEDAVSAYRRSVYEAWQFTTKADILRGKRKRMEDNLWWKREYRVIHRRALYVWVFWCSGISGVFEGLWAYIVGVGRDYHGGGYKGQLDGHLFDEVMRLFPIIDPTLFEFEEDWQQREKWKAEFVKRYQRGYWCGKPQGKAPVWAEMQNNRIKNILGRAQWPSAGR